MTTVLGLDLSYSSCGWALFCTDWTTALYGHWELAPSLKTAAAGCARLHKNLFALTQEHGSIDVMAVEQGIPEHSMKGKTNAKTVRALAGLEMHALSFGAVMGIRTHLIPIGSWRTSFLGSLPSQSNLDWKTLAQIRAKQIGMSTAVHDEAEAIGVLDYQLGLEGITPAWRLNEVLRPPLEEGMAA